MIGWFKLQKQLGKWISGKQEFFKPIKIEEIVIFIIKRYNNPRGKLGEHDKSL